VIAIELEDRHVRMLASWASVGRTIDAAMDELMERDTEQANWTIHELSQLKAALAACNRACQTVIWAEEK
jgi:hypothetical protein